MGVATALGFLLVRRVAIRSLALLGAALLTGIGGAVWILRTPAADKSDGFAMLGLLSTTLVPAGGLLLAAAVLAVSLRIAEPRRERVILGCAVTFVLLAGTQLAIGWLRARPEPAPPTRRYVVSPASSPPPSPTPPAPEPKSADTPAATSPLAMDAATRVFLPTEVDWFHVPEAQLCPPLREWLQQQCAGPPTYDVLEAPRERTETCDLFSREDLTAYFGSPVHEPPRESAPARFEPRVKARRATDGHCAGGAEVRMEGFQGADLVSTLAGGRAFHPESSMPDAFEAWRAAAEAEASRAGYRITGTRVHPLADGATFVELRAEPREERPRATVYRARGDSAGNVVRLSAPPCDLPLPSRGVFDLDRDSRFELLTVCGEPESPSRLDYLEWDGAEALVPF